VGVGGGYAGRTTAVELPERQGEHDHVGDPHLPGAEQQLPALFGVAVDQLVDQQHEGDRVGERDQQHQADREPPQQGGFLRHAPRVGHDQGEEQPKLEKRYDKSGPEDERVRQQEIERDRDHDGGPAGKRDSPGLRRWVAPPAAEDSVT
jgi:hypothetical protein